jgi:phospholipid/cholesterol/gamma-HCH transport system substrate-binding protein
VLKDNAQPAVENLQKAIASVQRAADNLDAIVSDARPGVQNFSKSTLPEANQLVRDLRELSQSLKGVSERVEQGGIGGTLGPQRLPDYKPRKQR